MGLWFAGVFYVVGPDAFDLMREVSAHAHMHVHTHTNTHTLTHTGTCAVRAEVFILFTSMSQMSGTQ